MPATGGGERRLRHLPLQARPERGRLPGSFYTGREQGDDFNRLVGLDGQLRLSPSEMLSFHGFASFTDNPSLPDKKGLALNAYYSKSTRDLDLDRMRLLDQPRLLQRERLPDARRPERHRGQIGPKFYPGRPFSARSSPAYWVYVIRDHESRMNEALGRLGVDLLLPGNAGLTLEAWAGQRDLPRPRFDVSCCRLIANSW